MEECITILDKTYPVVTKRYCYPVNPYIGAAWFEDHYKVFKIKQGTPFIGTRFASKEDAIGAAKVFDELYGEYFVVWDNPEWVNADVPGLFRLNVDKGIDVYEFLKRAEQDGVNVRCASLHAILD